MIKNTHITLLRILNLLAFVVTVFVNGLANSLPLNGQTTGDISAKVPVLFTPASYVFGIWSLIYLALLAFVIYQIIPGDRAKRTVARIGYWFIISCICNSAWLFLWHYEQFPATLVLMLGLLLSLIMIYRRLDIERQQNPWQHRLLAHFPFSLYLGWISVATIANTAIVLKVFQVKIPPVPLTIFLLLLATGLAIFMALRQNETVYPLVIAWALAGIAVRHQHDLLVVAIPAAVLGCVVVVSLIIARISRTSSLTIRLRSL